MIESTSNGVILTVHVQPKALKFRVAAPPVEGEANATLCHHVAKLFSIPQRGVSVSSGQASRKKRIELIGVTEDEVRNILGLSKRSC